MNFSHWHVPVGKMKAAICLAGAVMAKRLGAEIDWSTCPDSLEEAYYAGLRALYALSLGCVDAAAQSIPRYDFCAYASSVIPQPLSVLQSDAAMQMAEHWKPILQFTYAAN